MLEKPGQKIKMDNQKIGKEISIILPTYNGEKHIEECLDALKKQSFQNFELIIIDDGSQDRTREILDNLGYKYHRNEVNLGFVKTLNKGVRLSKGKYILIVDQDMVFEKDYLLKMIEKNKDFVSARMYYYHQKDKIRGFNLKVNLLTGKSTLVGRNQIDKGQFDNIKGIQSMGGGCFMVKKEIFDKLGLFDEKFVLDFADIDFCFRARENGYIIFPCSAKCFHKKEEDDIFDRKRLKNFYLGKKRFLKKHSPYYPIPLIPMNIMRILR